MSISTFVNYLFLSIWNSCRGHTDKYCVNISLIKFVTVREKSKTDYGRRRHGTHGTPVTN